MKKKNKVKFPCTKCEHYPYEKCTCDKYAKWAFGNQPRKDKK